MAKTLSMYAVGIILAAVTVAWFVARIAFVLGDDSCWGAC